MNPPTRHLLLIDDEPLARMELRRLLKNYPHLFIAGEAGTMLDARELLSQMHYDLVFLDVQLRGGTGFDLLDSLHPAAQVVFVTAHDQFALRAFEVNALDYLLKPVTSSRLHTTLQRLDTAQLESTPPDRPAPMAPANHRLTPEDRVYIRTGTVTRFIPVSSIRAVTSFENYTHVQLSSGETPLVLRTLKAWEEVLPDSHFVRIHRQTLVNLTYVKRIERRGSDDVVFWLEGAHAPLSASRRQLVELKHHLRSAGLDSLLP
jgi:two-component system, LytTR family, response regulator